MAATEYLCPVCGRTLEKNEPCIECDMYGTPLRFDESSPDGRVARYEDELVERVGEEVDPRSVDQDDEFAIG